MGQRGAGGDGSAAKSALLVSGGLALAWLAVEIAFKPVLDRLRSAVSSSDPARDPDDDLEEEAAAAAAEKADAPAGEIEARNEEDQQKHEKEGGVPRSG